MDESLRPALQSEELPAGTATRPVIRRVLAGGSEVLLARLENGEAVAFAATCPHQATSLEDATLWDGTLRCPRHLYLYDPRTGENILPTRDSPPETLWKLRPGYLPVYRVEERDGWIWVADEPEPPPPAYDPDKERRPAGPLGTEAPPAVVADLGPVEHPPQALRATVGEDFEVALLGSARPGHLWQGELPDQLVVVSQRFDAVRLRAAAPGQMAMRWSYARPWDVEPAEVRTFVVHVQPGPGSAT